MFGCATKSQRRRFEAEARRNSYGDWWPATKHSMLMAHRRDIDRQAESEIAIDATVDDNDHEDA